MPGVVKYGVTEQGFKQKRLRDIQDSMKTKLENLQDPETGETLQINFDEDDPFIQIINAFCDQYAACWQLAAQVYGQFNPLLASGHSLSGLVQLNGITRKKGSPSSVTLTFFGEPGVLVPAGTVVTDEEETIQWKTIANATIDGTTNQAIMTANSTVNGAWNYVQGTINKMVSEINGIQSVVNTGNTIPGVADENDAALRKRRDKATETPSIGIIESVYGAIADLPGVTYCKIFSNRTLEADNKGIPGKSIACVVLGGDDEEIAKTIFTRSGISTGFFGNTTVNIIDSMQVATTVSFQRPVEVPVAVSIEVDEIEGSAFPNDYASSIQNAIIQYAAGGPMALGIESDTFDDFGFPVSENVVVSRLYIPCNAVKGVKVTSLTIGKVGSSLSTNDVEIDWGEIAQFDASNITVTKVS